jgi:hypothetical protein
MTVFYPLYRLPIPAPRPPLPPNQASAAAAAFYAQEPAPCAELHAGRGLSLRPARDAGAAAAKACGRKFAMIWRGGPSLPRRKKARGQSLRAAARGLHAYYAGCMMCVQFCCCVLSCLLAMHGVLLTDAGPAATQCGSRPGLPAVAVPRRPRIRGGPGMATGPGCGAPGAAPGWLRPT